MDLAGRQALSDNTIFRIYSMTKPVIATEIMMLCKYGKLDLNNPASKFIPEFKTAEVAAMKTVKMWGWNL